MKLAQSSAELENSAEDLVAKDSEQQTLLLDVKTAQDQYQLYVDKLAQARMTHALDENGILNVVVAQEPVTPVLPQSSLFSSLAAFLFTGLLLNLGAPFLSTFSTPRCAIRGTRPGDAPILAEFGRIHYIERGLP